MRRLLLTLTLIVICFNSYSQTKTEINEDYFFTEDSTLNGFILKWIGKPYKLGGKTEYGIDCSQFNKRLYKDVYKITLENVCYKQFNQTQRIKRDSLTTGDILFFRSKGSPSGWHCGIYLKNTYFIHASNKYEGVKISSLTEPRYSKNYRGAGRIIQRP